GIIPWWPDPPEDTMPELVPGRDEYVLYEIEPDRWVGCFRSPYLEDHVCRPPDLDYRNDDLASAGGSFRLAYTFPQPSSGGSRHVPDRSR
ncbi:MAG: hypothetical protein ACYSUU_04745, partial [Planctomycetota bacterium]